MKKKLSIIIPCYNEEESISAFYTETMSHLADLAVDYEFIFIDDGSTDETLTILKCLAQTEERIKFISFSRNFGKESAIYAGLEHATGDYMVLMDCDLQDPPSLLGEMLRRLESGDCDCVATYREDRRGEPWLKNLFATSFYKLFNKISAIEIKPNARDYRMMNRQMADWVVRLTESNRFSKGILAWVGFRTEWIAYENKERVHGKTKWSFWSLFLYSLDGITSFSAAPLFLSSFGGLLLCVVAFLMMLYFIVKTLLFGDPVEGYPSLVSIVLFLGGIQLLSVGIIGHYLSKTYMESKQRPIYIPKESNFYDL